MEVKRAVGFIVGSDESLEAGCMLAIHKEKVSSFVAQQGWILMDTYYNNNTKCEAYYEMIADAREGMFDVIVVLQLQDVFIDADFISSLRKQFQSGLLNLVSLDGNVNTLTGDVNMLGYFDWRFNK